ncbi:hypothetical protein DFJ63DRAFT_312564 [Scheffersomyces coipomensis]|uniref:uncharacterized protein n=1 Tax=Scheffersomyces coipomensis TaxID=1788519 RepID=UPI00315C8EF6
MTPATSSISSSLRQSTSIEEDEEDISFLERFPPNILYDIYILSKPRNNLPFVNKRLYQILHFNPTYSEIEDKWDNLSIIIRMIRTWYLVDLNTRLDFDLLERKLNYYESYIAQIDPEVIGVGLGPDMMKIVTDNLQKIRQYISTCQLPCVRYALSDGVLTNNFNSEKLVSICFNEVMIPNCGNTLSGDFLDILTLEEIDRETKFRLRAFKVMFSSISYWLQKLQDSNYEMPTTTIEGSNIPQFELKETILEGNEGLPEYNKDDEDIDIKTENLSNKFNERELKDCMYDKGINSRRKFELVVSLNKIHHFTYVDVNRVLANTFRNLQNKDFDTTDISLWGVTKFLLSNVSSLEIKGIPPIDEVFRLYDYYENRDCRSYGVNYLGQSISEDIIGALFNVLEIYDKLKYPLDDLWQCVFDLKNHSLARFLMSYSKNPNFSILQDN